MSIITDIWRQLVRRRLWPLALLLVAALVAVPVLLTEEPAPVAPPAPSADRTAGAGPAVAGEPIVAMATAEDRARRRRVLGARKNPFEPVPTPAPKPVKPEPTPDPAPAPDSSSGGGAPAPPAGGGGGGFTPTSPVTAPPVTPEVTETEKKRERKPYELTVRFGEGSGATQRMSLLRLEALPGPDDPLLVYLGPGEDGRSAVFMVDARVKTEGDGTCNPDPSVCETIELREGDTQFFDVTDLETGAIGAQYQLDLIDIHRPKSSGGKKAAAARAAAVERAVARVSRVTGQVAAGL